MYRVEIQDQGDFLVEDKDDTVLRAALLAGLGFPYECNSGGCGACKYQLISGEIEELYADAPGLSARDKKKNLKLACQTRPLSDLKIKIRLDSEYIPPIRPTRQVARLVGKTSLTHDIREFRFLSQHKAKFLPGQYAKIYLFSECVSRCYSMSNLPNAEGVWDFQIRKVAKGLFTGKLFEEFDVGDSVVIDGPYGNAYLRTKADRDIVCIAGGSGLAPMISIARGAAERGLLKKHRLYFFYGGRTPADICGREILSELPEFDEAIAYYPIVSDLAGARASGWAGEVGMVHELVPRVLQENLDQYEYYFAGPPPMVESVLELLMAHHKVPFQQIHFDRFF